jgi:hypothetical protein
MTVYTWELLLATLMNSKNNAFNKVFGLEAAIMVINLSFYHFKWLRTKKYSLLCSLKY